MIIREARLEDASAIAHIHVDTWRTTYRGIVPDDYLANLSYEKRESSWAQILNTAAQENHFIYVAENEVGLVGFADGGKERTNNSIYKSELYSIYILETFQRKGIGRSLTRTLVKKLDELKFQSMLVWVLADNQACKFYQAFGGNKIYSTQLERGGKTLTEVAYGWTDTKHLIQSLDGK